MLIAEYLPLHLTGIEIHLGFREICHVIGVEHLCVELARVVLWQEERLADMSLIVN